MTSHPPPPCCPDIPPPASCTALHHACGAHLGRVKPGGQGQPLGANLCSGQGARRWLGSAPSSPLTAHPQPAFPRGIRHHSLRPTVALLLFQVAPPPPNPAPGDQLLANLMAPESSSWSHKPRTQTRHCPSPHSQAPHGTT